MLFSPRSALALAFAALSTTACATTPVFFEGGPELVIVNNATEAALIYDGTPTPENRVGAVRAGTSFRKRLDDAGTRSVTLVFWVEGTRRILGQQRIVFSGEPYERVTLTIFPDHSVTKRVIDPGATSTAN